jgi:hypothetical protein
MPEPTLTCTICGKPIPLEIETDDNGKPVHEECLVADLVGRTGESKVG